MNAFDIQGSFDIVANNNQKLLKAAQSMQNTVDDPQADAQDMYQEVMAFNEAVQERNLSDKVMFVAAKNNFSVEQQVLQELKQ